jgi:signal transduction histidine kinase
MALGNAAVAVGLWLGLLSALVATGAWQAGSLTHFVLVLAAGCLIGGALFGLAGWFLVQSALGPLQELAARLRKISAGNFVGRLPESDSLDEVSRLAADFNAVLHQLQESFGALDRLTADVSHELRTPLTAMRAVSEVALRERNPAVLHDAVGSMLEEINRMNQLLDRLLLLTRPANDAMPTKLEAGLVRKTLLEVSDTLGLLTDEKQQVLLVDCADHLLAVFDPALLRLALMNLVQNAIRYSPPGTRIRLRGFAGSNAVMIEVADEGPGIAPEHQQKIFERFSRVDKARSRAEGGVGLGLAIVKWAAERMGARVELQSEPGRGSVFRLRLRALSSRTPDS